MRSKSFLVIRRVNSEYVLLLESFLILFSNKNSNIVFYILQTVITFTKHWQAQPRTTGTKTSSTIKGRSRGRPKSKTRLAPEKTKRGVQMAVHERKTSKFLGLYNTGRPSNFRLGLRSPYVVSFYEACNNSDISSGKYFIVSFSFFKRYQAKCYSD